MFMLVNLEILFFILGIFVMSVIRILHCTVNRLACIIKLQKFSRNFGNHGQLFNYEVLQRSVFIYFTIAISSSPVDYIVFLSPSSVGTFKPKSSFSWIFMRSNRLITRLITYKQLYAGVNNCKNILEWMLPHKSEFRSPQNPYKFS